jgi:hypothetical protein
VSFSRFLFTLCFIILPILSVASSNQHRTNYQTGLPKNNKSICLLTKTGCKAKANTQTQKIRPKANSGHLAKNSLALRQCTKNDQLIIKSYNTTLLSYLSITNAATDQARHNALISGESYSLFDQQLNDIASHYNLKAKELYSTDEKLLLGCKEDIASPTLFQPFTP